MRETGAGERSPEDPTAAAEDAYRLETRLVSGGLRRSGVPADEAEEIAQEAMVRSLGRSPTGAARAHWLGAVARNIARDRWRRTRTREKKRPLLEADRSPTSRSAEDDALSNYERDLVRSVLRELSPEARLILCLRVLDGRPAREVGVLTGRSEEAVRQIQLRSLRRLRALLAESGWEPSAGALRERGER